MPPDNGPRTARRIVVGGRVQGVGFRPFAHRAAVSLGLCGWVRNSAGRVLVHVEGPTGDVAEFEAVLQREPPPLARPRLEASDETAFEGAPDFRILESDGAEAAEGCIAPDLFCCDDCLAELGDPLGRRHRYPFTNCTQCGPRYTIIAALPYDRPNTAMAGFALCAACRAEYDNPLDRRFHAQPLACPDCGPRLGFQAGAAAFAGDAALAAAVDALNAGQIVAVRGVGGYHLMCDAADDLAVARLRDRKRRPHKPLAVMFPLAGGDGLQSVRASVELDEAEARACVDPARPIVLARRRAACPLSPGLAPGLNQLGVFLPYSPLHHLLLATLGRPLVATSGNVSGEPVITDRAEAERRLAAVADSFLHHDRPILRPADDSVVRVIAGSARPIRLGRGVAPLEIDLPAALAEPTLAVGGHLKSSIALGWGRRAVISPHIGDLDSPRSLEVFERVIGELCALYRVQPRRIACDAHPGYASARWARAQAAPVAPVQHHVAHASALAGEHPEVGRWLVFAWDGLGLGDDGDLWGGEALIGAPGAWRRAASLRPFQLIGGDRAAREPWRAAAALMWDVGRDWRPETEGAALARQAFDRRLRLSRTSSAGRLFDAAACLVLGLETASFEGQAPMWLEAQASAAASPIRLPLACGEDGVWRTDWAPLLDGLADTRSSPQARAAVFHESLAHALADQASTLARVEAFDAVGLVGGVFQNRRLAERALQLLAASGRVGRLPRRLPANDGGLAFGQLIETLGRDRPASMQEGSR
jgi:hydrogenase maturation protein HypF